MFQDNLKKALIDWCNNNLQLSVTWPGHLHPGGHTVKNPRTVHMGGELEKILRKKITLKNMKLSMVN